MKDEGDPNEQGILKYLSEEVSGVSVSDEDTSDLQQYFQIKAKYILTASNDRVTS
jgi:hypothetical protein